MAYILIALNIFQVLAGCFMTGGAIYICMSVTRHLYSEKSEIRFVFGVFALFGTHIIIEYLIGIKIVERCFVKAHKRSTKRILYLWLFACSNTILDLLVLATMIVKISKHIIRSIRHSMEKGMRHYLSDPLWKHTMDRWQFTLRCCGVNDFKDWYMISWLDKYHINVDSPRVHSLLLSKDHLHLPVTPWSCCRLDFPMQCLHDPVQQVESAHLWKEQPEFPETTLNQGGCLEAIRYPIEISLVIFLVLCILLILVQIAIIIVSRLLYTSCRNSVILRDTDGIAPGWLFGRDCLADKRGRTLSEIMLDLQSEGESSDEGGETTDGTTTQMEERTIFGRPRKPESQGHKSRLSQKEERFPWSSRIRAKRKPKPQRHSLPPMPLRHSSAVETPKPILISPELPPRDYETHVGRVQHQPVMWKKKREFRSTESMTWPTLSDDSYLNAIRDSVRDPVSSGTEDALMLR